VVSEVLKSHKLLEAGIHDVAGVVELRELIEIGSLTEGNSRAA